MAHIMGTKSAVEPKDNSFGSAGFQFFQVLKERLSKELPECGLSFVMKHAQDVLDVSLHHPVPNPSFLWSKMGAHSKVTRPVLMCKC
jgi:hypothetical protein